MSTTAAALGRFEDHAPEDVLAIIDWMAKGMERDTASRFDGYRGAGAALNMARAFVVLGDCPEANAAAAAEMGAYAEYALDALYWTDSGDGMAVAPDDAAAEWRATVKALIAMSHLAKPIREALKLRR